MLRVTQLPRVLAQLTDPSKPTDLDGTGSGKVLGALLMTKHGALLGSSGFERAALLQQQAAVQAKLAEERAEAEASAVGSAAAGASSSSSSSSSSNSSSSPGSGPGSNELPSAKIIGAIVANVWGEYAGGIARGAQVDFDDHQGGDAASSSSLSQGRFGNEVGTFGEGELQVLLLELEYGQIAVAGLCDGNFILCAYANEEMPTGLLKARLTALATYLDTALEELPKPAP